MEVRATRTDREVSQSISILTSNAVMRSAIIMEATIVYGEQFLRAEKESSTMPIYADCGPQTIRLRI